LPILPRRAAALTPALRCDADQPRFVTHVIAEIVDVRAA
jgi:hypothetical protein